MEKYGKWEVIEEKGEGGQGKVYLVRDTLRDGSSRDQVRRIKAAVAALASVAMEQTEIDQAHALVKGITQLAGIGLPTSAFGALKVLHTPRESIGVEKAQQRMESEVEALQKIDHPNIVKLIDQKLEENWFVMEYFPKGPLEKYPSLFKGNTLGALTAFRQLLDGVDQLHSLNRVHRDIKPANVFVAEDGRLVLGDMGLVFFTDESHTRVSENYENVGSRDWMPPWAYGQGLKLEDIHPTFDLFCLGKLLWVMVSGRTILPLWYHRRDSNNLEKMFPSDDSMAWVNVILDQCIVENEVDCVEGPLSLLRIVDDCLKAVRNRGQRLTDDVLRTCKVCGFGFYRRIIDENDNPSSFGLRPDRAPVPNFKFFSCDHCGHSQIFRIPTDHRPPAWPKA